MKSLTSSSCCPFRVKALKSTLSINHSCGLTLNSPEEWHEFFFHILCCFPDDIFGIDFDESWRHNTILFDTMACGEEVCSNCCHLILVELDNFYDVLKETHSLHVCTQLVVVHALKCLAVVYDAHVRSDVTFSMLLCDKPDVFLCCSLSLILPLLRQFNSGSGLGALQRWSSGGLCWHWWCQNTVHWRYGVWHILSCSLSLEHERMCPF